MKAFVIIFIVISVIVACALLFIAVKDLIDDFKKARAEKQAQVPFQTEK